MKYFPIDTSTLHKVLNEALSQGGDYADIYFEHSRTTNVNLLNDTVNRASSNIDYGASVRVVVGDKTGFSYVEEITPETLLQAAHTASRIAHGVQKSFPRPCELRPLARNCYPISQSWFDSSIDHYIPFLLDLRTRLIDADSRIVNVQARIAFKERRIAICNSLGDILEDLQPTGTVALSCVINHEGRQEMAHTSRSFRIGCEMLTEKLKQELVDECLSNAHFALSASQPKGGVMPVVMAAGASGILLHEAIGHAFEADFNRKGESIFSQMLGKQIADQEINVVDDGTQLADRGSINFDDEGAPTQLTYLVKDGKLNSYLHDRISARHYGVEPTGNGRRESFRHMPIPRMRSTYMLSGKAREEDLIASVRQGIYVKNFTNGQVQIGAGDFTFYVKSGYLIENGRLTQPIKDINIIGNGPQALADIHGVADNNIIDHGTWMCGKEGQSCPVSCGMPSVLVEKLTVGGR